MEDSGEITEPNSGEELTPKPEGETSQEVSRTAGMDALFLAQSEVKPIREVELTDKEISGSGDGAGDIESRMDYRRLTDLQVADRRLNPNLGFSHLNFLQMARVFPDKYNALFRILVKDLMRNTNKRMAECIAIVDTALSIGIDGEGRIDVIAVAKGISEHKSEEEKKKLLP